MDDLQKAANEIVNLAAELSQDPDYLSPFAISARKKGINFRGTAYLVHYYNQQSINFKIFKIIIVCKGGKPDDITVLLARVTKS